MRVGLNGCGRVGKALLQLWISMNADITVVFIRNSKEEWIRRDGFTRQELCSFIAGRPLEKGSQHSAVDHLLSMCNIDTFFELTPTDLSTAERVFKRICFALTQGVHVITANKAPVQWDCMSLYELSRSHNARLGLSAVMGAALPSYAIGVTGTAGSRISEIWGILNGTTNYLLNQVEEGIAWQEAVQEAIRNGIAEKNYRYDVEGIDTAVKLAIICSVVLKENIAIDYKRVDGIQNISVAEYSEAKKQGYRIKLIGKYTEGAIQVKPEFIRLEHPFFFVSGSNKALHFKTDLLSDFTLIGGKSGLREVAASMHRDYLNIHQKRFL